MITELLTSPASLPVTLVEMRAQVWQVSTERTTDDYLTHLIQTATDHVERITWRKIITQEWRVYLDSWPDNIVLPFGQIRELTSVMVKDTDGNTRTLDTSEYNVEIIGGAGAIYPVSAGWPSDELADRNGIMVDFLCGWAVDEVPPAIKHAILLLGEHWHRHASPVIVSDMVEEVPMTVDYLLGPWMPVY